VVFALSSFQLAYGREMRMYGFLSLGGVVTAWAAERWLEDDQRRWMALAVLAATSCAFLHATGVIVLLALLAVPLLRRDRSAWELRSATVVGLALFAVVWGGHALSWRGATSNYPKASLSWLSISVNETIAAVPANRWIVLPLLVVGGIVIVRRRDCSSRVWLILAVAPVVVLYLMSFGQGVLIPKSLMAYSWGSDLALGAVVGAAWRRSVLLGGVAAALLAILILPYTSSGVNSDEGAGGLLAALDQRVGPGDAVAISPARHDIRDLIQWYRSVVPGVEVTFDDTSVAELEQLYVTGEAPSGRVWLVSSGQPSSIPGYAPCGPVDDVGGSYRIECLAPTG